MQRLAVLLLAGLLGLVPATAALAQQAPSPYQTRFAVEGPLTLELAGLSATGPYLVQHKRIAPAAELAAINRAHVPGFNRFSAGTYGAWAQATSDELYYSTLALGPVPLAFNAPVHGRYGACTWKQWPLRPPFSRSPWALCTAAGPTSTGLRAAASAAGP